jgi:hypothetical protein
MNTVPVNTAIAATYRRPLSPSERSILAAEKLAWPVIMTRVVQGRGRLDLAELRTAVAVASATCPGARVVRRGNHWVDSGIAPPVRLVDNAPLDQRTFAGPGSEGLHRRLDPVRGPNCEVLLFTAENSTVVFRVAHSIMDGKGLSLWVESVFRALRGESPIRADSPATEMTLLKRFGRPGTRAAGREWESPFGWLTSDGVSAETADPPFFWRRRDVPGSHRARVAKVAAAITGLGSRSCRYLVPVNLRRHDPGLFSTANLNLPLLLDVAPGSDWTRIHTQLKQALADRDELIDPVGASFGRPQYAQTEEAVRDAGLRGRGYDCTAVISDLGVIDLAAYSTGDFTAEVVYGLPPFLSVTPVFVIICQLPDRVILGISCRTSVGSQAAEALLDIVAEGFR